MTSRGDVKKGNEEEQKAREKEKKVEVLRNFASGKYLTWNPNMADTIPYMGKAIPYMDTKPETVSWKSRCPRDIIATKVFDISRWFICLLVESICHPESFTEKETDGNDFRGLQCNGFRVFSALEVSQYQLQQRNVRGQRLNAFAGRHFNWRPELGPGSFFVIWLAETSALVIWRQIVLIL